MHDVRPGHGAARPTTPERRCRHLGQSDDSGRRTESFARRHGQSRRQSTRRGVRHRRPRVAMGGQKHRNRSPVCRHEARPHDRDQARQRKNRAGRRERGVRPGGRHRLPTHDETPHDRFHRHIDFQRPERKSHGQPGHADAGQSRRHGCQSPVRPSGRNCQNPYPRHQHHHGQRRPAVGD